jgi:hypothetical protein
MVEYMSKSTKQNRLQQNINKVIGQTPDGEFCVLQYVFRHDKDFLGAVGSTFRVVTKGEYDEAMSPENATERLEDQWCIMVKENGETRGLDEYVKFVLKEYGDEAIYDLSYREFHDSIIALHDEAVRRQAAKEQCVSEDNATVLPEALGKVVECVGGGRMFCKDGTSYVKFTDFLSLTPDAKTCIDLISAYEQYTIAEQQEMRLSNDLK